MKIEEVAALLELVEQLEEIGNEDAVLGRVLIQTAQAIRVMLGEIQRLTPLESMRSRLCDALGLPADSAPEPGFAKVELGFGRVEVGEGTWVGVPALIFGKNGEGVIGKATAAGSRFIDRDECLAVVTFANVESLDVVLGKLIKCRADRFPSAIPADRVLGREIPLFVPLAKRWYLAFKAGTKRTEYRPAGILISKDGKERRSPWNADTCRVGRPAVIANGYQVSGRLEMVIESFAEQPDAGDTTAAFDEIYPGHRARGGRVAAIAFREPTT